MLKLMIGSGFLSPARAELPRSSNKVWSSVLSSTSNRLKSLARVSSVLCLGALAAACSSGSVPTTYDLSAPTSRIGGSAGVQISVNEPAALQSLSTQQILVKDQSGTISFLGAGQWADNLPRLIQTRLIN